MIEKFVEMHERVADEKVIAKQLIDWNTGRIGMELTASQLAIEAATAAADKKAKDIKILDIEGLTPMTDCFVICSANSSTQVEAVARAVEERIESLGTRCKAREGLSEARWVLLDFGDLVVHVFRPEEREFYNLERLWGDAVEVPFEA